MADIFEIQQDCDKHDPAFRGLYDDAKELLLAGITALDLLIDDCHLQATDVHMFANRRLLAAGLYGTHLPKTFRLGWEKASDRKALERVRTLLSDALYFFETTDAIEEERPRLDCPSEALGKDHLQRPRLAMGSREDVDGLTERKVELFRLF